MTSKTKQNEKSENKNVQKWNLSVYNSKPSKTSQTSPWPKKEISIGPQKGHNDPKKQKNKISQKTNKSYTKWNQPQEKCQIDI